MIDAPEEALSEMGVEIIKNLQEDEPAPGQGTSWVGLLLGMLAPLSGSSFHIKNLQRNLDRYALLTILPTEFHKSIAHDSGPIFTEDAIGTSFACICTAVPKNAKIIHLKEISIMMNSSRLYPVKN